jgi:polyisoprenoid-binding protein YceI
MARYEIDPDRSTVWISARSSVHPIHSGTTGLQGYLDVDVRAGGVVDAGTAAGSLSLPVDRLRSGNALLDSEMRRRIDARRYPTIDGRLTELVATADADRYAASGELTFRGVTQNYEDELVIEQLDDGELRVTGESTFDVRDFDFQPPRILLLRVEPDVTVRIEIFATAAP